MAIFELELHNTKQSMYLQLTNSVRKQIEVGILVPGEKLPSVNTLAADLKVNRHTVMRALAELVAEGWLESKERVGYLVAKHLPIENSAPLNAEGLENFSVQGKPVINKNDYRLVRAAKPISEKNADPCRYNFAGGKPDTANFPFKEFKRCMSQVLTRPPIASFGYGESAGVESLIYQVKQHLRQTRSITGRDIVVTNGSQEAMFIIAQLFLQPGDSVAVEALGYPPAWSAFKSAGANLVGIHQDDKGMNAQDLEEKLLKGNVRLIYLTPLHQYPTTVTLPVARRMQIYKLAAQYKIPIIEDDYDHEYHYRCQPLAPMAASDPEQIVIYISTFSKIMFPGARIGFLAVNSVLAKAVEEYRLLINHKNNVLMQLALAKWMEGGGFSRHLRRTTRIHMQRRDNAVKVLDQQKLFDYTCPDGGMAFWLKIKDASVSATKLASMAYQKSMFVQHEGEFHLEPSANKDAHIRLGFAGMDESTFAEGIEILGSLIR